MCWIIRQKSILWRHHLLSFVKFIFDFGKSTFPSLCHQKTSRLRDEDNYERSITIHIRMWAHSWDNASTSILNRPSCGQRQCNDVTYGVSVSTALEGGTWYYNSAKFYTNSSAPTSRWTTKWPIMFEPNTVKIDREIGRDEKSRWEWYENRWKARVK